MASVGTLPSSTAATKQNNDSVSVDKILPEGINEMKIKDDKEMEAAVVDGNGTETGHIIVTTIGGKDGQPKQTISYMAERIVGQGSFGIVFQAKCLETGETVAIKKVLQDKRYKNRELQTMRLLDHPNVVSLKHCFFSTTERDELYLNLVLEYVPETVYRVSKHYSRANQRMPMIYVKLYTYQMEKHQIPMEYLSVGFIGAGKMAESIARGIVASGLLPPHHMSTAVHSNLDRHDVFQSFGVNVFSSNEEVVEESDVVIFSVKPQVVKKAITELRSKLSKDKLIVSVAAGIKLKDLQEWAGHDRVIRVMPNTPAAVGEGASVMSLGTAATEEDGALVAKLFGSVGKMFKADEKMFDAVTGLSGSGPAYIFLAIEALADGGVAAGLPRELALGLASQTVLGAAAMVSKTGKHPGVLKDDVTSPGGTTIAGVHELEKGSFRATLMNAVVAAANRSRELSQT